MEPRLEALATCIIPFWLYHAFLPSPSNPSLVTFLQALALFLAANVLVLSRDEVNQALISAQEKLEASNLMHAVSLAMLIGVIDHTDPHQPK